MNIDGYEMTESTDKNDSEEEKKYEYVEGFEFNESLEDIKINIKRINALIHVLLFIFVGLMISLFVYAAAIRWLWHNDKDSSESDTEVATEESTEDDFRNKRYDINIRIDAPAGTTTDARSITYYDNNLDEKESAAANIVDYSDSELMHYNFDYAGQDLPDRISKPFDNLLSQYNDYLYSAYYYVTESELCTLYDEDHVEYSPYTCPVCKSDLYDFNSHGTSTSSCLKCSECDFEGCYVWLDDVVRDDTAVVMSHMLYVIARNSGDPQGNMEARHRY